MLSFQILQVAVFNLLQMWIFRVVIEKSLDWVDWGSLLYNFLFPRRFLRCWLFPWFVLHSKLLLYHIEGVFRFNNCGLRNISYLIPDSSFISFFILLFFYFIKILYLSVFSKDNNFKIIFLIHLASLWEKNFNLLFIFQQLFITNSLLFSACFAVHFCFVFGLNFAYFSIMNYKHA